MALIQFPKFFTANQPAVGNAIRRPATAIRLMVKYLFIPFIFTFQLAAWDGFYSSGYARGAAAYLDRPAHAHAAALSGAATAWSGALAGLQYNPALADAADGLNLFGSYLFLSDDRRNIAVDGTMPGGEYAVIMASFRQLTIGCIEERDNFGNLDGTFEDRENMASLGAAGRFAWNISAGVRARYLNQKFTDIQDGSAHGFGFDAGALWRPDPRISIGVSGLNIGSRLFWATGHSDIVLPQARIGVAGFLLDSTLVVEIDGVKTLRQPIDAMIGAQYILFGIIALRAGAATSIDIEDRHSRNPDISGGLGIRYSFFGCDYAITIPTENARDMLSHSISLILQFNPGRIF